MDEWMDGNHVCIKTYMYVLLILQIPYVGYTEDTKKQMEMKSSRCDLCTAWQ